MKIGFTGTRKGMTNEQQRELMRFLVSTGGPEFHHGTCHGADTQADGIADRLGCAIIPHPPRSPAAAHMHERNHAIVDSTELLVSTPSGYKEITRGSGTWSTMRYAQKIGKPCYVIWPDGSCQTRS